MQRCLFVFVFRYIDCIRAEQRLGGWICSGDGAGVAGDPRPQVGTLLGHGARDGGPLHLALVVHDHPGVVLAPGIIS